MLMNVKNVMKNFNAWIFLFFFTSLSLRFATYRIKYCYKVESNQIFKDSANIYMDDIFIATNIIKCIC